LQGDLGGLFSDPDILAAFQDEEVANALQVTFSNYYYKVHFLMANNYRFKCFKVRVLSVHLCKLTLISGYYV